MRQPFRFFRCALAEIRPCVRIFGLAVPLALSLFPLLFFCIRMFYHPRLLCLPLPFLLFLLLWLLCSTLTGFASFTAGSLRCRRLCLSCSILFLSTVFFLIVLSLGAGALLLFFLSCGLLAGAASQLPDAFLSCPAAGVLLLAFCAAALVLCFSCFHLLFF